MNSQKTQLFIDNTQVMHTRYKESIENTYRQLSCYDALYFECT